jgi:protein kinase C substrate 80K-H
MIPSILLPVLTLLPTAAWALKGVDPVHLRSYEPIPNSSPARWKCLNSSQEIPYSSLNDNYCDCDDGSDEPSKFKREPCNECFFKLGIILGTGACLAGKFYCVNEGHIGTYIRSSRVNDGLCEPECCDGSDEAEGVCPNVCASIGEEYRRITEAARKIRKTGSKIRSTYIVFAQKEKKRLEDAISSLRSDITIKKDIESRMKGGY